MKKQTYKNRATRLAKKIAYNYDLDHLEDVLYECVMKGIRIGKKK